ncbi:PhzF family phenazine biosynthesis protein [Streptomyces olivoreticuli]
MQESHALPRFSSIPAAQAERLLGVLGLAHSVLPVALHDAGIPHLYVMADTPEAVRAIVPNFPALGQVAGRSRINIFALTGTATAITRMFSPYDRVPEDPACGSAAGPLAAHLVRHQLAPSGVEITLSGRLRKSFGGLAPEPVSCVSSRQKLFPICGFVGVTRLITAW